MVKNEFEDMLKSKFISDSESVKPEGQQKLPEQVTDLQDHKRVVSEQKNRPSNVMINKTFRMSANTAAAIDKFVFFEGQRMGEKVTISSVVEQALRQYIPNEYFH